MPTTASPSWLPAPLRRRREVARAMVDILRDRTPQVPERDPAFARELVAAVRLHRIAPLAHVRLRDVAPAISAELRSDRDDAFFTYVRGANVLAGLGKALGDDVAWVTFKGLALSALAHPVPGLRSHRDLDVLVSPHSLRQVVDRLQGAGWRVADVQGTYTIPGEVPGQMHWWSPQGLVVDLHWTMVNEIADRRRYRVPTEDLLARRVRATIMSAPVWVLDPVDAFVHVCLHAAETGANRLSLLLDVDQLARRVGDWDAVAARARQWGAEAAVALSVSRAGSVLGTPLPADVWDRLGVTSGFRAVVRAADRVAPVPRLRRQASLARMVSRSARPAAGPMLVTIGSKLARNMWGKMPWVSPPTLDNQRLADDRALEGYVSMVEAAAGSQGRS